MRWKSSSIAFGDSFAPRSSQHFRTESKLPASDFERASSSLRITLAGSNVSEAAGDPARLVTLRKVELRVNAAGFDEGAV
jgi:hypothetical protein